MIWDGECDFCRYWIERWRAKTAAAVDYATSQSIGARYPEIDAALYQRAVVLIEPDGLVRSGAEAVIRSLACPRGNHWLLWCYENVPGFAGAAEFFYRLIAENRQLASRATRIFVRER